MTGASVPAEPAYRLLGPLEVAAGPAGPRVVPPGRQQTVLATLLLAANRVVGIDQLIDAIWYDNPPVTARTQVQICVSGLRTTLAGLGPDGGPAIVTQSPGYLLRLAEGQLDVAVFTALVDEADTLSAAGELDAAALALQRALALWRGPALSGTTSRTLQTRASQLDEKRLNAIEAHVDLQLRRGRHHQVITEVGALVDQHPLRERLRGQLMLALYRSGRQAEALEVYRSGRELLIDQLGLEPGDELRALESAILAGDSRLHLGTESAQSPPRLPEPEIGPYQLPGDIGDFTGHADLLDRAERMLSAQARPDQRAVRVLVLVGKPGAGKSVFAVHLAHRLREAHFPDGQLYADLGGTRTEPVTPADVLGRFLRALGIPGSALPDGVDERAEMFRSLLAHKKVLVVLDDAQSENHLRLLMPGSPTCAVLVTSRARLTGLPGAQVSDVDVLAPEESLSLLTKVVGAERVDAEPAAAQALVRLVGGLPLALRIVAARLAARPRWSLAWMLERLADERRRLDELAHGEMMVRASLALSYDGLPPDARKLLALLSGPAEGSFPIWVAAAVLDADPFDAADLLELLVDVQLLEIVAIDLDGSPRYKFHDIIRLYAREQAERNEPEAERRAALERVGAGWLALAEEAHRRIYGGDYTVLHGNGARRKPAQSYVDQVLADPGGWLDAERANLRDAVGQLADAGMHEQAWDLAVSLVALYETRCYFEDWELTHRRALAAAQAAGNRRGAAALVCSLGSLHLSRSRPGAAELVESALTVFTELGDREGQALAGRNLALLDLAAGAGAAAMDRLRQAGEDFRAARDPIGQAHVLALQAQLAWDGGAEEQALAQLREALAMCQGIGARRVEVQVRYRLSWMMGKRGEIEQARDLLTGLLDVVRETGDLEGEARILHRLGSMNARLGAGGTAIRLLRKAVLVRELMLDGDGAAQVRAELEAVAERFGLTVDDGELPEVPRPGRSGPGTPLPSRRSP
ncbi:AfsR/SARP family transcriptional regulator [Labedaea rhizosphaerae]|nr:AfsR/SARP family transcriptional regulator [Labedaea rhizosphaerae]